MFNDLHKHGYGAKDSAYVEDVLYVVLIRIGHSHINGHPPTHKELKTVNETLSNTYTKNTVHSIH